MAIFKVTVQVIETIEADIAIEASCIEEALEYARGTDEYLEDSVFDHWYKSHSKKTNVWELVEVNKVTDIKGYSADSLPWNTDY